MFSGTLRTGLIFGAALALLIGSAVLFAPRLVDMRALSPVIAGELGRALGRSVNVRGDIFLSLAPYPRLIVKDVSTVESANVGLMLSAEEAHADLRWGDLILGRYTVAKLTVVRPIIEARWDELTALSGSSADVAVTRGQLTLKGLASPLEVDSFDAELTKSIGGATTWTLSGLLGGQSVEATGRLGAPTRNAARNIQASVKLPEADLTFDMTGVLADGAFKGAAKLSALHASDALSLSRSFSIETARWPWTKQALSVNADVTAKKDAVEFENGALQLADQGATFTGRLKLGAPPDFSFAVELGVFDTALWIPGPTGALPGEPSSKPGLLDLMFAGSAPWQGEIRLNGTALRQGPQAIRDLALDAALTGAQWDIRNAAVVLPGQTRVSFAGLWSPDTSALEGSWRALGQDPHAFLSWLGVDAARLPPGKLTSFDATGAVQLSDKIVSLNDMDIGFDATRATGRISFGWGADAPFGVNLDFDRLALEGYWPILGDLFAPSGLETSQENASYGVAPLAPWLGGWAKARGVVRIAVPQLTWRDAWAGALGLDVAFESGMADVRSLALDDGAGNAVWIGGKIASLDTIPAADNLQFDVKAADMTRLLRPLGFNVSSLKTMSPVTLNGAINGPLLGATLALDGKFGPLTAKGRGSVDLSYARPKLETTLEIAHPNAGELRAMLWKGAAFNSKLAGAVSVSAKIKAENQKTTVDDITGILGPHKFSGHAQIDDSGAIRQVSVELKDIDLDWTALSPWPFLPLPPPGDWQGDVTLSGSRLKTNLFEVRDFSAHSVAEKNAVELAEWKGKIDGGAAQIALKWAKEPDLDAPEHWRHALQGQIVVNDANPALLLSGLPSAAKGRSDVTMNFSAKARRPEGWLASLGGGGSFRITLPAGTALKNSGVLAPLSAVVRAESADGRATAALEASGGFGIAKGVAAFGDLAVRSNAYNAAFAGNIDLVQQSFDLKGSLRLKDRGLIVGPSAQLVLPPTVPMSITGPLQAPTIKLDVSGVQR